jgi:hypothetical protein
LRKQKRQAHQDSESALCLQNYELYERKKTRQVDGIYRTTFILGESHILAIKKESRISAGLW